MSVSEDELQLLVDERAIRAVIYRYCRAIDRRQYQDIRRCFHPGATDHHGSFYGGVDEFIAYVEANLPNFERCMHFVGNLFIEVEGDTARSEAYALALARIAATDELPERDNQIALRYVDDFRRIDGRWAILHRKCVYEWTRTDPVPSGWGFTEYHLRGRADRSDMVFSPSLSEAPTIPDDVDLRAP